MLITFTALNPDINIVIGSDITTFQENIALLEKNYLDQYIVFLKTGQAFRVSRKEYEKILFILKGN